MSVATDSQTTPAPYVNDSRLEKDSNGVWHVLSYSEVRNLLKEELIQDGIKAELQQIVDWAVGLNQ